MSWSILEKDVLKVFDSTTNLDPNLNDLDNGFEYLLLTLIFSVHDINWGLLANINRG